jgi:hypothetical protein
LQKQIPIVTEEYVDEDIQSTMDLWWLKCDPEIGAAREKQLEAEQKVKPQKDEPSNHTKAFGKMSKVSEAWSKQGSKGTQ